MLKGKRMSILGDSVSTYKGASNDASANFSTSYNPYFYRLPFPLEKTYWSLILDKFGMSLCVNNSWSGGNLSGIDDESSGVNRASQLSRDDGEKPDFIIVFMGLNDLGRGIDIDIFSRDYESALLTIKKNQPNAAVCCVNMPDRDPIFKERAEKINASIEKAVAKMGEGYFIADLYSSRLNNDFYYDNTVDGLHPDEDGMRIIAEVISDAIIKNINC